MNEETARLPDYRVIISGGRDFDDFALLKKRCDHYLSQKQKTHNIIIVSGAARGADSLGERYAYYRGFGLRRFPADWDRDGKAAGPIRNTLMAKNADALIVCWNAVSKGTANMIKNAMQQKLILGRIFYYSPAESWKLREYNQLKKETADFAVQYTKTGNYFPWLEESFNKLCSFVCPDNVKDDGLTEERKRFVLQPVIEQAALQLPSDKIQCLNETIKQLTEAKNQQIKLFR